MFIIILERDPFLTDVCGGNKNEDFGKVNRVVIIYFPKILSIKISL